jgi:LPXTG-site transpeptidase (sortase) family protein
MDEASQADELAVRRLEHLLLERRRPISERRARAMAAAERALDGRFAASGEEPPARLPVYAPATWHGAREQDRFFRSLTMYPLRAHVRWALPAPSDGEAAAVVNLQTTRRQVPLWLGALLTGFEALAVVTLVVVVALLYRHLYGMTPTAQALLPAQTALLPDGHDPSVFRTQAGPSAPVALTRMPSATPAPSATRVMSTQLPQLTVSPMAAAYPAPTHEELLESVLPPGVTVALETPTLTPTPREGVYLVIPAIGVDAPVLEGDSAEELKAGVGHRLGSANPGEPDNMVVSAHDDIYGEIFRDLDKLQPGDDAWIQTESATYRYVVHTVVIVAPTEVQYMDPSEHGMLTMITCYPYLLDTHRVVVVADLVE